MFEKNNFFGWPFLPLTDHPWLCQLEAEARHTAG